MKIQLGVTFPFCRGDRQDTARDQTVIGTTDLRLRSAPKVSTTEYYGIIYRSLF
jgi:hypothetical protein